MSARSGFRSNRRERGDGFDRDRDESRIDQLRVPPHSVEAEQAVLGGLMLAPEAYDRVNDQLTEGDFYRRDHQMIYRAIRELSERERPFDAVTLGEWFESQGKLELVGDGAYLIELASTTPSAANIVAYAEIVRDKAVLRQLIQVGTDIVNDGFQPEGRDSSELLAGGKERVRHRRAGCTRPYRLRGDAGALKDAFEELRNRFENGGNITGLPTGYNDFDAMTAGLQPTDLIILAARPAMGKTTFALNIAEYAAIKSKKGVAVFSMEMSASQLAMRLISSNGRINAQRLRTGQLEDEDWSRVTSAIKMLKETKIFIDDTPGVSPEVLRSKCRRLKREHDLGLVVIDYLQLMSVPGNSENRATEISEISRSLKGLAKELHVPVIALSQLNRSLETRTDKRPVMADLRESGAIEQDADMIVFIYRDDYYNKENSPDKGLAEIIIGKHRGGPTGSCKLKFFGEYTASTTWPTTRSVRSNNRSAGRWPATAHGRQTIRTPIFRTWRVNDM
jgi:replicative DNA helicase